MDAIIKDLGKIAITASGVWNRDYAYDKLCVVEDDRTHHAYLSRKAVPSGVDIDNKEYWQAMNVSGYADSNVIQLPIKENGIRVSYTIAEAIKQVANVGRKPGVILSFWNNHSDDENVRGSYELWMFNSDDLSVWEQSEYWVDILNNRNKFVGWFKEEVVLKVTYRHPTIGMYAYVGATTDARKTYHCWDGKTWEVE